MLAKAHENIEHVSTIIKDADIRRSYRENLPWNREVLRLWAEAYPEQPAGTAAV